MKVQEFLADPARWCKNHSAKRAGGTSTSSDDPLAVRFCLASAIGKCYGHDRAGHEVYEKLEPIIKARNGRYVTVIGFNDDPRTTHDDILAVCREADI